MGFSNYMQKPLWDPSNFTYSGINFSNFMNSSPFGGFQTPLWQTSFTSSSKTNTDNESYEDWKKRKRAEREQNALKNEFLKEQQEEINKTKDLIEAQSKMIDAVKKGKKSDGSTVVEGAKIEGVKLKEDGTIDKEATKPKKKGFWGKCGEWLSSAGSAVANMGKALICWDDKKGGINWKRMAGFDENGKWRPWKSPTLVAAVAVGACFIPVVGPFIGGALCAYGLGSGAVGVYKGVKKLNSAKTEEEKEQARQDVCSGAITGVLSAFGLRGIGKAFRGSSTTASTSATSSASGSSASATSGTTAAATSGTAGTTSGTTAAATSGTAGAASGTTAAATSGTAVRSASLATPRSGFFGKTVQYTSQFGRDITVNAYRGTKAAMQNDLATIAAKGGGFNGFRKAYGQKVSDAWKGFNSWKQRYDNKFSQMENSINNRLASIKSQLQELRNSTAGRSYTPAESRMRVLLEEEEFILTQNLNELRTNFSTTRNKNIYDNLTKKNSTTRIKSRIANRKASAHPNRIKGKDFSPAELETFYNRILKEQRTYGKELSELIKLKENTMRVYAKKVDQHATELADYVPNPDVKGKWWKPSTWRKNEYQLAIGGKNPGKWSEIAGLTLTSQAAPAYLSAAQWNRDYSVPMFGNLVEMTPEQTEAYLKQLEQEKKDLEKALENITNIKDANEWNQLKAQAQAEAQREAAEKAAQEADAPQQG